MDTPSNKVSAKIIENLRNYADLDSAVQAFALNPSEETIRDIDTYFEKVALNLENIRELITEVASDVMKIEPEDKETDQKEEAPELPEDESESETELSDEETEQGIVVISGVEEGDGIRLN